MNFSSIEGHSTIKNRLVEGVASGRISHAQMFVGDSSTSALPLAVAYARYILCPNHTESDVCQQCPTCYRTAKLEHPDLHFVFPVNKSKKAKSTGRADDKTISDHLIGAWREFLLSNDGIFNEGDWYEFIDIENKQGLISKEDANELLRKMAFKSFEGGYKIVIVYLPERMNDQAANTLLKLIEEPPAKTLFLFVSEQPDGVIATIRSRVQSIALPSLSGALLARNGVREEEYFELFVELMRKAYTGKYLELFDWVEGITPLGREAHKAFCERAIWLLRDCYLTGIGAGELAARDANTADFVGKFAPFVNHLTVEALVAEFELVARQVKQNGNARIIFTHFALIVSKILVNAKRSLAAGE